MANPLGKLFGSEERVRLLRLFLNNPEESLAPTYIATRSRVKLSFLERELDTLRSIGFVTYKWVTRQSTVGRKTKSVRQKEWVLDPKFAYTGALRNLLFASDPFGQTQIANYFKNAGRIKLLLVAGIFIQEPGSRADILIVGDNLKRHVIERALESIESEIGKELSYAILPTEEFTYRLSIYDKFIRDILDYPHRKILDKIGV